MTTDRQKKLLEVEDSRFHAIGPVGTGLGMIATTEKINEKIISFGLPSAPALYLNMSRNAYLMRESIDLNAIFEDHPPPQGTWPEDHSLLFNYFEYFTCEVIFSYTALEAFANEVIPQDLVYDFKNSKKSEPVKLSKVDIERLVSLDEKLKKVIPDAYKIKRPNGTKIWQDYKELKAVRDRLIHLKSIDRKASGSEHQTIWGLMLEKQATAFSDLAARVIGHFQPAINDRRWFHLYVPIKK